MLAVGWNPHVMQGRSVPSAARVRTTACTPVRGNTGEQGPHTELQTLMTKGCDSCSPVLQLAIRAAASLSKHS